MITIPITYNGQTPQAEDVEVVSGQRETLRAWFSFSPDWDTYPVRTAMFSSRAAVRKAEIDADGFAVIPAAVVVNGTRYITISAFGNYEREDGEIPRYNGKPITLRVEVGGDVPDGNDSDDPAYEKLLVRVVAVEKSLGEAVAYAKDAADAANNAAGDAEKAAEAARDAASDARAAEASAKAAAESANKSASSADAEAAAAKAAAEKANAAAARLENAAEAADTAAKNASDMAAVAKSAAESANTAANKADTASAAAAAQAEAARQAAANANSAAFAASAAGSSAASAAADARAAAQSAYSAAEAANAAATRAGAAADRAEESASAADTAAAGASEQAQAAEQAAQRANTAAVEAEAAKVGIVQYNDPQTLTEDQQGQARENIGAADVKSVNKLSEEIADYESVLKEYEDSGIEPQTGFYNLRMQYNANTSYKYIAAPVVSEETIQVTGVMPAVAGLAVCIFADESGNFVGSHKEASAEAEAIADEDVCTVPDGAVMVYVNSRASTEIAIKKYELVDVKGRLENAENRIEEINAETESIRNEVSHAVNKVDEITKQVAGGINLLPPESVNGYIDTTDGETFISNESNRCSTTKIPVRTQKLYAMVNPDVAVSGTGIIAIVEYDSEGNYIKTDSIKVTASGVIMEISFNAIAYMKIWTNGRLELADVCIAEESFETFEPYSLKTVVKQEAIDPNPILAEGKPFFGKTIVNFGDSIFGNKRPPNDVSTALANITGATVYNCGFGGCRMASHNANWDAFSMYRLAYAIAHNDYTLQDAVDVPSVSGMPAYFEETRTLLKSIDWSKVDIITIAYGTNDWTAGKTLDNAADALDTNTFCGALRYSLETIITAYPHIKIFACGQAYRFWMDDGGNFIEDSDTKVLNDVKLTDFVEATEAVSKAYHVPFIDNYNPMGINKWNRGYYFPANDGTHHNVLGAKLLAEHIAHELF